MFSFTRSGTLESSNEMEPQSRFSSSPWMPLARVRCICSPARWISRSVTQNTGSPGSSPMRTCTFSPFFFTMTPWRDMGTVAHWYFLMPP